MLQRDRADPGLQLWTYDEILFPLLMLPAPSCLEAAHPHTTPTSPLWGWQLSHCSDTIPLSCSPRASDSRQLKHHHCGRASTLVRTGILQFLEERTCSKVCEPGHGRLVVHVLQMRPVRAANPQRVGPDCQTSIWRALDSFSNDMAPGGMAQRSPEPTQHLPLSWPRQPVPDSGNGSLDPKVASHFGDALSLR